MSSGRACNASRTGLFPKMIAGSGRSERRAIAYNPPPRGRLPRTLWGVRRNARSEDGDPRLIKTLEDTPFYVRSMVGTTLQTLPVVAIHESLSLTRVANPIVRAMLPFRMPRRSR